MGPNKTENNKRQLDQLGGYHSALSLESSILKFCKAVFVNIDPKLDLQVKGHAVISFPY